MKRDDVLALAKKAGGIVWGDCIMAGTVDLGKFLELAKAEEREECAMACDEIDKQSQSHWPHRIASMIRARGQA